MEGALWDRIRKPGQDVIAEPAATVVPLTPWEIPPMDETYDARWRDAWFATQLANVVALHIYGVPLLKLRPAVRADIRSFADSFTEDAGQRYSGVLNAVER